MGQATLQNEIRKNPPRERLNSIPALWRDYMWRYVEAERQDPCQYYTAEAPDLATAIRRACDSRGRDGKLFNHQSRVWQPNRDQFAQNLLTHKRRIKYAKSFEELFKVVERAARKTDGIGPVTEYDVACRLGYYLDLEPNRLYVHAGVLLGLKALRVKVPRGRKWLTRRELPPFFRDKNLELLESFLCGYRSEIERVAREYFEGPKGRNRNAIVGKSKARRKGAR